MENRRGRASTAASDRQQSFMSLGPLAATDPQPTVEALQSSQSPRSPRARKPPFNTRLCHSGGMGSFEGGAVAACRTAPGGSRPAANTGEA